jgi:hypothetical protein
MRDRALPIGRKLAWLTQIKVVRARPRQIGRYPRLFARNDGVPGSSPGVGSSRFAGAFRSTGLPGGGACAQIAHTRIHTSLLNKDFWGGRRLPGQLPYDVRIGGERDLGRVADLLGDLDDRES